MKLEELKRLCEQATPGPWRITEHAPELYSASYTVEGGSSPLSWENVLLDDTQYYPTAPGLADARLIAAARNALPLLLAVAEAAKHHRFWQSRFCPSCDEHLNGDNIPCYCPDIMGAEANLDAALAALEVKDG